MNSKLTDRDNLFSQHSRRGAQRLFARKYDEAIEEYNKAIELKPDYAPIYSIRGYAYRIKGDFEAAIKDYNKLTELRPDNADAYCDRGIAYSKIGDFARAIQDFNKAIQLKPNLADTYNGRGLTYHQINEVDLAIEDYNTAIQLRPDFAKAYNNRALAYQDKGDTDKTIEDTSKAIEFQPNLSYAYNNRGNAYVRKGITSLAIKDFNKAIHLNPNLVEAYCNRGVAYENMREFERAIEDYTKAIELQPDYAEAYNNRGVVYNKKGEIELAIENFNKAIEINPKSANAYRGRGHAYWVKGEFDRAIVDHNKAIELNPNLAEAYYNRGNAYFTKGELERAIEDLDKAIELQPDYAEAYYNRGVVWSRLQQWENARLDLTVANIIGRDSINSIQQIYLTKSKYLSGLQCHKRLWYEKNYSGRAANISRSQQRKLDQSKEVGILARDYFPEGVLINTIDPLISIEQTEAAIARGNTCIFEASFMFNDVLVKCDILQKDGNSWKIIEVKASTVNSTVKKSKIVKEEYLHDLAIQKYVLTGYGLSVSKTHLMLINSKACVYPDLSNLFTIEDVTDQVDFLMDDVDSNRETFKTIFGGDVEPNILIGEQCEKPYPCPFKEYCWQSVPEKSIFTISRLGWDKKDDLIIKGIFDLEDVPVDYPLSQKQRAYVNSVIDKQPEIDNAAIKRLISNLEYPIHFLDFETDNPAIPRFDGLRPYQHFPFQYSCHVLHSDGRVEHHEYIHTDTTDPRKPLVESLLECVAPHGSIVVYNANFEKGVLEDLALSFPEYASTFEAMIDRLWDQLDIFKNHYTHPDFCGSNSLKNVFPVLVPSLRHENLDVHDENLDVHDENLDVRDGLEAQAVWNLMLNATDETEKGKMIEQLKAYCELDTLATLEIHKVLTGE